MRNKKRKFFARNSKGLNPTLMGLLVGVVIALLFMLFFETFIFLKKQQIKLQTERETVEMGNNMISGFERELNALLYLNSGIEAYIKINYSNLDSTELKALLKEIHLGNVLQIRNIGIAVNTTIKYIEPLKSNEKALGVDYRNLKAQWPKVKEAIQSGKPVMDGPLNLVQGGKGLIYRKPIYIDSVYWGLLSTVIDANNLLDATFGDLKNSQYKFAISNSKDEPYNNAFWGDREVFKNKKAIILPASVPSGMWYYAILPDFSADDLSLLRILNWIGWFMAIFLIYVTLMSYRSRERRKLEREQYRLLSENASDVIWLYSLQKKRFTYLSPSVKPLSGYTQEEAITKSIKDIFYSPTVKKLVKVIQENLKEYVKSNDSKVNFTFQAQLIRKDGSLIWVEASSYFQTNREGEIELVGISRNIEHTKAVEHALKESEQNHKIAQEIAKLGHWELDLRSNRLTWSDEIFRIFEIDPTNFKESYEAFLEAIHPMDRQMVDKAYNDSLKNKRPYEITHRLLLKDGEIKYVNEKCITEFDNNGNPIRSLGTLMDITDTVKAEEKLRQLSQAVEQSPVTIFIVNLAGNITYANSNVFKTTGYTPDELIGKNPRIFKSGETSAAEYKAIWSCILKGQSWKGVFHNKKKNGELYWESALISPILSKEGKVINYLAIKEDITEKMNAEVELKNSQMQLQTIVNTTISGVSILDAERVHVFANPNCVNIHGYTQEEITGTSFDNLVHPDDRISAGAMFDDLISERKSFISKALRVVRKDLNEVVWINLNLTKYPRLNNAEKDGFLIVFQDITKRLDMEQELVKLNADKDRFMSILAHDLRSPFNGILGLLSLILEDIHKFSMDELVDLLMEMDKSAKNVYSLLEDLLIWSKSQSGNLLIMPERINLKLVCDEVMELLTITAKNKRITLKLSANDKMFVFVDMNMMRTVIRNLVSNAIKFTPKGGEIELRVDQKTEHYEVTVADNGVGMTPEKIARLWDYAKPQTTPGTEGESGTGLGLLLCKEMVTRFGGEIWVKSEKNKGTEFIFSVPFPD